VNRRAPLAIKPNPWDGPRSVSFLPICKVDLQGIPIPGGREVRAPFVNCFTYAERGLSYQAPRATGIRGRRMDAILNFLSRATGRNVDVETVETTIIFCGIGLLVLLLTYGLDLSPEFI
jgi:hypothetical protein